MRDVTFALKGAKNQPIPTRCWTEGACPHSRGLVVSSDVS